jgi:thiamine-monophosphate kinase
MVSRERHLPKVMKPLDIGWFITAINLSDIAAMGGKPLGLLLSLGLTREMEDLEVKEIVKGANICAERYGAKIIGGDTKECKELTITGAALGIVSKEEILLRTGMKEEDILAVTGTLGRAGAGYLALKHGIEGVSMDGLIHPLPRIEEGKKLAKIATSCMDISDGLASSLYQLMDANRFGFEVDRERIPLDEEALKVAKELNIDPYSIATDYGGDYELLVALPAERVDEARKSLESLTMIGRVVKEERITIVSDGRKKELKNIGYEHFKGNGCKGKHL